MELLHGALTQHFPELSESPAGIRNEGLNDSIILLTAKTFALACKTFPIIDHTASSCEKSLLRLKNISLVYTLVKTETQLILNFFFLK